MKNKKLKTASTINLVSGYLLSIAFLLIIFLSQKEDNSTAVITNSQLISEQNKTKQETVYVDRFIDKSPDIYYKDHLKPVYTDINPEIIYEKPDELRIHSRDNNRIIDRDIVVDGAVIAEVHAGGDRDVIGARLHGRRGYSDRDDVITFEDAARDDLSIDRGLLDRRLAELEYVEKEDLNRHGNIGIDKNDDGIDMSKMTVARDDEAELGEIDLGFDENNGKGYGVAKGGELYAYNYPSQGVGAGIGSSAIGAGAGGGAGLGAAIGEGILNGEVVPTLGGVGTGASPLEGQPSDAPPSGGVGGLIGGAGAGGAAGLTQGYITEKLGMGPAKGIGYGGNGRGYNYDHLPRNGALHIMMHVDGSGSILNTRKQLDTMKETILKDALLPYYNNDENLYNNRVTIVSNAGERTLKFFAEAAKKKNVLAIAFQDEAQPAYHLPNFNKKPEDHYVEDITKLKSSLNEHTGVYRGVMFQVDRGKTFAKSFKEFVGNAFKGKGYLSENSLKKYYRDNNFNHIKNKDGIVFSDEYHAKDSGDPQYYLNLIFEASKKIGLELDIYGGGLKDGKYNSK